MTNRELFLRALARTRAYRSTHRPSLRLESVEKQLEYLLAIEDGKERDRTRLDDINVGRIAVHEIEGSDETLAELLHQANAAARAMPR